MDDSVNEFPQALTRAAAAAAKSNRISSIHTALAVNVT